MHNRVYIEKDSLKKNDIVTLTDEESHHLISVKRFKVDDIVELCCESGDVYNAKIKSASLPVTVTILKKLESKKDLLEIHVYFGNTKFKTLESAIVKCTEMGVRAFTPVICERSVAKDISKIRAERLKKLVREAVKQSGQTSFMEIDQILPKLSDILEGKDWSSYNKLFLFLPDAQKRLFEDRGCGNLKKVALFIGPEGDFSPNEVALFNRLGIEAYTFGEGVLRSDTAAIAAVASVRAIWG